MAVKKQKCTFSGVKSNALYTFLKSIKKMHCILSSSKLDAIFVEFQESPWTLCLGCTDRLGWTNSSSKVQTLLARDTGAIKVWCSGAPIEQSLQNVHPAHWSITFRITHCQITNMSYWKSYNLSTWMKNPLKIWKFKFSPILNMKVESNQPRHLDTLRPSL